jgi:hypothetical protein
LVPGFCQGATGGLLFFDLQKPETLNDLDEWVQLFRKHTMNIPILLCGINHGMTPDEPLEKKIKQFQEKYQVNGFISINMDDNEKVTESFELLSNMMMQSFKNSTQRPTSYAASPGSIR